MSLASAVPAIWRRLKGVTRARGAHPSAATCSSPAGPPQLKNPKLGLSHNLGGVHYNGVCGISIVGLEGA
jgi:acetyl-CoA C-acetyltransferase